MDELIRTRRPGRFNWPLRLWLGFVLAVPLVAAAAPQLQISPLGYRVEQVAAAPGVTRGYDVTIRAGVVNTGDAARDVVAQLTSSTAGVVVLDGHMSFGNVARTAPLRPVISLDTARLRFVLPKSTSILALLQYVQTAVESLSWRIACGNCGSNRPPVAHAGADQTAHVGQRVTLDGSGSYDPDGQSLRFGWTVVSSPTGSSVVLSDAATVQPAFTPDRDGAYVFRLVVNDGVDSSAPATVTITTHNSAPVARAGEDQTTPVGIRVRLNGAASTDVDGDALTYEWTLLERASASAAILLNADPAVPFAEFIVDKPGRYVAELVVHDGRQESVPDTVVISTVNSAPVANAGPDRTAAVGSQVDINGTASLDADGDPLMYRWSLTAPAGSYAVLTASAGAATGFVIDKPGSYLVQLIVNDGKADSVADTAVISTVNSAPVAHAGADQAANAGATVELDGSASHDVDGDPIGFNWALTSVPPGSVTALTDPDAVHPKMTTDRAGAYVSQLVVSDGRVNSAPATVTITARNVLPPAPDTHPPDVPNVASIVMTREDAAHIRVKGAAGSVEGEAQVTVLNFTTGVSASAAAAADGSFSALIAAADGDALLVSVRDAAGNASAPASLGALKPVILTIDAPLPGQNLPGSTVVVAGRLLAPPNTGVTVNGRPAAVYFSPDGSSYETQIELAPPQAGQTSVAVPIEVVAHTPDGRATARTVDVQVRKFSDYVLEASPAEGPAPLRVSFELVDSFGAGIQSAALDFNGDGVVDQVAQGDVGALEWLYSAPGTYLPTAKITDSSGSTKVATTPVHVHERTGFIAGVRAVWNDMAGALAQRNLAAARVRLNESAQRRYGPAFDALLDRMPQIVQSFSQPQLTEAGSEVMEFVVARELEGIPRAFFIYMTRGPDGVWRVAGM